MGTLSQADLLELNKSFERRTPLEMIQWGCEMFGDRIAAITSMQRAGNVICHIMTTAGVKLPILFVDTGVMFEETLQTRDRLIREYGLNIITLSPKQSMQEQTAELGILYLDVDGQKKCCQLRKVDPLLEVADQYDCLIGSLRRSDGGKRAGCPLLSVDPEMNSLRINPLANFSNDQLASYLEEHQVILNPLHDQGYATIGCNRCTTPVMPYEDKRAGRWRHLGSMAMYCGLNPTDLDPYASPSIDLPQDLIDRILGRETDFMI